MVSGGFAVDGAVDGGLHDGFEILGSLWISPQVFKGLYSIFSFLHGDCNGMASSKQDEVKENFEVIWPFTWYIHICILSFLLFNFHQNFVP